MIVASTMLVELANADLPPGVLNIVTGRGSSGQAMATHPGIDKIVFTGSTPTGKRIMEGTAGDLKRLTLELGGNDAGIVLPDVGNWPRSPGAPSSATASTRPSSARCRTARRSTSCASCLATRARGARILAGGHALDRPGYFHAPTIVAGRRRRHALGR